MPPRRWRAWARSAWRHIRAGAGLTRPASSLVSSLLSWTCPRPTSNSGGDGPAAPRHPRLLLLADVAIDSMLGAMRQMDASEINGRIMLTGSVGGAIGSANLEGLAPRFFLGGVPVPLKRLATLCPNLPDSTGSDDHEGQPGQCHFVFATSATWVCTNAAGCL
eukprot:s1772_g16.t1